MLLQDTIDQCAFIDYCVTWLYNVVSTCLDSQGLCKIFSAYKVEFFMGKKSEKKSFETIKKIHKIKKD